MRRFLFAATLAAAALIASPAFALRIAMPIQNTAQKAIQADAVVVGKVTEIEKDEVEVTPHQGATDKTKMKVAVIKIETGLVGAKNVTHVKVLIPGAAADQPAQPQPLPGRPVIGRPIRPGLGGFGPISLKEGEEGLFFLAKHPTAANYYTINAGHNPIPVKDEKFKDELTKVKAVVAVVADPMAALKADKPADRLTAAATLIQKYRRGMNVPVKEVAIPAEETKAILKTLLDADWTAADKPTPGFDYQSAPSNLVGQLGLYPGSPNGLAQFQPKPGESYNAKYQEAFKAWHAKSGDKFEIKKFVPTEK